MNQYRPEIPQSSQGCVTGPRLHLYRIMIKQLFTASVVLASLPLLGCNDSGFAKDYEAPPVAFAQADSSPEVSDEVPEVKKEEAPKPEVCADPAVCEKEKLESMVEYSLAACAEPNTKKVLVCHVPPGNPAAAHTICIAAKGAVNGHGLDLNEPKKRGGHGGDRLGACEAEEEAKQ
jgi:hypothetical protein